MTNFEIETFFAIINTGSISKAAETLSTSQSALSRRIALLEEELGYSLFHRGKGIKNTILTPQGRAFVPIAKKMLELYGEAIAIRSFNDRRELSIAAPDSLNSTIMKEIYSSFIKQYPDIKLSIITNRSNESYRYMEEGNIDLAYIGILKDSKTIKCHSYFKEKIVFVCSKNASYPKYIYVEDLDIKKCIRFNFSVECSSWYNRHFSNADSPYAHVDNLSVFNKELFQNDGWSMIPLYIAKEILEPLNLQIREIDTPPVDRNLFCIYKENNTNKDLIQIFENFANRYLKKHFNISTFLY